MGHVLSPDAEIQMCNHVLNAKMILAEVTSTKQMSGLPYAGCEGFLVAFPIVGSQRFQGNPWDMGWKLLAQGNWGL